MHYRVDVPVYIYPEPLGQGKTKGDRDKEKQLTVQKVDLPTRQSNTVVRVN